MTMIWSQGPGKDPSWPVGGGSHQMASSSDPYLEWAERTDFVHLGGSRNWWVPLLIELNGVTVAEFAKQARGLESFIRVPQMFDPPPPGLDKFPFCTVFVLRRHRKEERLRNLFKDVVAMEYGVPIVAEPEPTDHAKGAHGEVRDARPRQMQAALAFDVSASRSGQQQQSSPFPPTPQQQWQQSQQKLTQVLNEVLTWPPVSTLTGGVVVGVIDDAIAFANDRFRCHAGGVSRTRFAGFWQQDVLANSTPLHPMGTGWTLTSAQIDAMTQLYTSVSGTVDEEMLYRRLRHQGVNRRMAHGTHVTDLAAGFDPDHAHAATTHLVGVQLPREVTRDISGSTLTPYALLGLIYMVWLARTATGAPLPLVVNMSYGVNHGPHDGTSLFERAVDQLIGALNAQHSLRVVLPAGNSHLTRGHASMDLPSGAAQSLIWRVLPDDMTPSFLEVWMPAQPPAAAAKGVRVRIKAPGGLTSAWASPGNTLTLSNTSGPIAVIEFDPLPVPPGGKSCVRIALEPTVSRNASGRHAPSGNWEIEFTNSGALVTIKAWIWRDDRPMGFPVTGRQSRFDDPQYQVYEGPAGPLVEVDNASPIKRAGSFNDLAAGNKTIVVGGVRASDQRVAKYSGSGPTDSPYRAGPDVVAVCETSVAMHGVRASGTLSGSRVAMNGTSVAAPHVTRWIADRFRTLKNSDRPSVTVSATPLPIQDPKRTGAGIIVALMP